MDPRLRGDDGVLFSDHRVVLNQYYEFVGNKKGHPFQGILYIWWRRRESNPRPQVLCHRLYMLILSIVLTSSNPTGRAH